MPNFQEIKPCPADTHDRPLQDPVRSDLMKRLQDISTATLVPRNP